MVGTEWPSVPPPAVTEEGQGMQEQFGRTPELSGWGKEDSQMCTDVLQSMEQPQVALSSNTSCNTRAGDGRD